MIILLIINNNNNNRLLSICVGTCVSAARRQAGGSLLATGESEECLVRMVCHGPSDAASTQSKGSIVHHRTVAQCGWAAALVTDDSNNCLCRFVVFLRLSEHALVVQDGERVCKRGTVTSLC